MSSRVGSKLREVISEVTGNARSDYANSLREEHRQNLLLGQKAYAIDNVASGITLFMPWRLHAPLESFYRRISGNAEMSVDSFKELVDNASLFPKSQSLRKKNDIIEYILGKVVKDKGTMDFEEFLHALFLLAKYRAAILRVTEQCAFNHLMATLIGFSKRIAQDDNSTKCDADVEPTSMAHHDDIIRSLSGISLSGTRRSSSVSTSSRPGGCQSDGRTSEVAASDRTINLTRTPTRNIDNSKSSRASSARSNVKSSQNNKLDDSGGRAEQLFKMAESNMKETCEIMKAEMDILRQQLEDYKAQASKKDELQNEITKLKEEQARLREQIESEKATSRDYKKQWDAAVTEAEEKYKAMQTIIDDLETQLTLAKNKLQVAEDLQTHNQQVQTMLAMQPEYESMLFSVFLSYRDEELVNGEFVMSEENCIAFCLDFGLDDMQSSVDSAEDPVAKLAFREVCSLAPDGKLTYGFFKEFLLRLAEIMDPQSTQKRAFQLLLMNTIFRRLEENRNARQDSQRHLIYPDEFGQLPYDAHPDLQGCQVQIRRDQENAPEGFMDVEGRMWFEDERERLQTQPRSGTNTPRFPD